MAPGGPCSRQAAGIMIGQTVGAGHFIQLAVPEQMNAMIERFLATTGRPAPT